MTSCCLMILTSGTRVRVCVFARVCVCVRVCARACVCVYILLPYSANVQDILEGTDQRSCVVNISWVLSAKFHHLRIWKCHISPQKTKTPVRNLLERKRYYIMCSAKRWYILILDINRPWSYRQVTKRY